MKPKVCPVCQGEIHYAGRRDLLEAVKYAELSLRRLASGSLPEANRVGVAFVWVSLRHAVCDAEERCRDCDPELIVYPTLSPRGHCTACNAEGMGLGPDQRCPVLGCPGSIVSG